MITLWKHTIAPAVALAAASMIAVACSSSGGPVAGPAPTSTSEQPAAPDSDGEAPAVGPAAERRGAFVPLDSPVVIAASEATYLQPDDRVLGVTVNGESRAYPINMMTYHHVANDEVGGEPVLVTF